MSERSSKAESIFFSVLEKPVGERAESLKAACAGDMDLRARVEKMLAAAPNVGDFLEQPYADQEPTTNSDEFREGPGTQIGHYKLLQEIGEGGFGVVYMAEQLQPIRRIVALKIIKPGMDTREVIARFEAERQALAMMDHANIARVFDAGAAENGRPYFVMELVKGVPINEFCDKNNFTTEQRLALFITVCRAVQHAHQKGVIHRDLKPSNIMITLHDGDPVPKVIDFGVSKAISQRLTEKTLFTRYGQMVGTPQYMSPEQAEMSGLDIDTRSDVYSLGVLLYELLTGTTPLEAKRLRTAGYAEMMRLIQSEDPAKPSTRLSTLGDRLTVICEQRKTDAKRLCQSIRGDLDWIVMKALEKHRDRRYETATEFARDIQRHLNDEPVIAGPPNATYLLAKIVRRNKVAVSVASVVLGTLIVGLAAAVWGFADANYHRGVAEQSLNRAQSAERDAIARRDAARQASMAAEKAREEAASRSRELARRVYAMELATAGRSLSDYKFTRARRQLDVCLQEQRDWAWRFLDNRYHAAIPVRLKSCEQPLFTGDGERLVAIAGSYDSDESKQVIVWDLTTEPPRPLQRLSHQNRIQCVDLSADDKWVVCGGKGGHVVLWDLEKGAAEWTVPARKEDSVDRSESFETGPDRRVYQKFKDRFGGVAFSPDGSLIAAASWDGHLRVLNRSDGSLKFDLKLGGNLRKVTFSPDGRWLVNGGVIVDTESGNIVWKFSGESARRAAAPAFSPDGRLIATGNAVEKRIHLWDWDGKQLTHQTSWRASNSNRFGDLRFCNGGAYLASAQGDHLAVWELSTRKKVASLPSPGMGMAWWLGVHPRQDAIGFGTSEGVGVWHYTGNDQRMTLPPGEQPIRLLKFSPNGEMIAMCAHRGQHGVSAADSDGAGKIVILKSSSGEHVKTIDGHFQGFCWLPDSARFITTREEDETHVMYALDASEPRYFSERFAIGCPHIDATGKVLTSIGKDFTVRTWNVDSGEVTGVFSLGSIWGRGDAVAPIGGLWNATVGPNGHLVAIGQGGDIRLWDTRTKQELDPRLPTRGRTTETLAFSRDGDRLFSINQNDNFTLFNVASSQVLRTFNGPFGAIAMSRDEKNVVSCGDGLVVWDVESGLPVITLADDSDGAFVAVDWSLDHERIAAAREDGTLHIWTLPTAR